MGQTRKQKTSVKAAPPKASAGKRMAAGKASLASNLTAAIDSIRSAIMMVDRDLVITYANKATFTLIKTNEGEFKSAELFFGEGYRVDTSDQAGTRWDYNLTGFRGEEEMAFNADPYVASGMFQLVADLVP